MTEYDELPLEWLAAWPALIVLLVWVDKRHGRLPLFLSYSYIAGLAINHWFGALVHSMPARPFLSSANTILGFGLTTWGLLCFVLGTLVVPNARAELAQAPKLSAGAAGDFKDGFRVAKILSGLGAVSFVLDGTWIAALPSMSATIAGGKQMLIAGICLNCWLLWQQGQKSRFTQWLAFSLGFPCFTVLMQGFLGFGVAFLATILIFVGSFYRPRWHIILGGAVALFGALSLFVAYLEHRDNLRAVVWAEQSAAVRINAALDMIMSVEPFDLSKPNHLAAIDLRLNQNELVGAAMGYVPSVREFAQGETFFMALISVVPRALWPDKPVFGGSMGLVTRYTGVSFGENTSVGIGQVMEFYVNFGWPGVAIGFFILGVVIRYVDFRLANGIQRHIWSVVGMWFAIGVALGQPLGQLVEVTGSVAAAALVGYCAQRYTERNRRPQAR